MTYGWAILIVIIVAAALYVLGVFNPQTFSGPTQTGFGTFNIPAGGWIMNSNSQLVVQLRNAAGATVNITAASLLIGGSTYTASASASSLTSSPGPVNDPSTGRLTGVVMGSNNQTTFTFSGFNALTSGASYSAALTLTYTNLDTGLAGFTDTGTLTGTRA